MRSTMFFTRTMTAVIVFLAVEFSSFALSSTTMDVLQQRSKQLQARAEKMGKQDGDFAAWIKCQDEIFKSLRSNIEGDLKVNPERAKSEIADWAYLLDRLETECDAVEKTPDMKSSGTLNVRDFGAKADGVTDDGPAIRKAIAAAVEGKARRVFLPTGKYLTKNEVAGDAVIFRLLKLSDLLIEGEPGTELLCENPMDVPFVIDDCRNVRLDTLKITFINRGYSAGVIVAVNDPATLDVAIDPGMPEPTREYFHKDGFKGLCRFYSGDVRKDTGRPVASSVASHAIAPEVSHIKDNIYRFKLKDIIPVSKFYAPGMHMVYYARGYGNHCIVNQYSDRTRLNRIEISGSGAMAFLNDGGSAMFITNCRVVPENGAYVTTAADGLYFRDNTLGGYIANNEIKNIGDDFINNHNTLRPAFRQEGNILYFPTWFHGKVIERLRRLGWIRASTGEAGITAEVTVEKVEIVKGFDGSGFPELIKMTCKEALPPIITLENAKAKGHQVADMFTILENQCHGQIIVNNSFCDGLSRMLIGGRNWVFAGNRVDDSVSHPYLMNIGQELHPSWMGGEGFQPRNIIFRDNTFNSLAKSVLSFNGAFDVKAKSQPMAHFVFQNNHVNLWNNGKSPLMVINGVDGLKVKGNAISSDGTVDAPVFDILNSCNVVIEGNYITGKFSTLARKGVNIKNIIIRSNTLKK